MTIDEILTRNEGQSFDRKSIRIALRDLAETVVAMANADGGTIAIGVSDRKRLIEGVDQYETKLNELLRVPLDFCNPSVSVQRSLVSVSRQKTTKKPPLAKWLLLSMCRTASIFLPIGAGALLAYLLSLLVLLRAALLGALGVVMSSQIATRLPALTNFGSHVSRAVCGKLLTPQTSCSTAQSSPKVT